MSDRDVLIDTITDTAADAAIAAALVAALNDMPPITKSRTAQAGTYSYDYADLADVLTTIRAVLTAHGLAVTQDVATAETGGVAVTTTIIHNDGGTREYGPLIMGRANDPPQALGSAITYARRYALLAALCIATEDDDGHTAGKAQKTAEKATRARQNAAKAAPASDQRTTRMNRLMALYGELGYDRAARLAHASAIIDRDLDSFSDLTDDELVQVGTAALAERKSTIIDGSAG